MRQMRLGGEDVVYVSTSKGGGTGGSCSSVVVTLPSCLDPEVADYKKTADIVRRVMLSTPHLQVMHNSTIDPTFAELCSIDWTIHSMQETISKLRILRSKSLAKLVAPKEEEASLQEVVSLAEEIEVTIQHAIVVSRWIGLCTARRRDLIRQII